MQDLVPVMMGSITGCLDAGQETYAQEALELLVELAGAEPKFLRRQIADVVEGMLQVAEAAEWEDRTRHFAVEFVITLAEARECAPGMMRRLPQFVGRLFAVLMQMLLDVEDDSAWHSAENEDADAGEGNSYGVAQEGLDRLAIAIGGNVIMPSASELLPQYLSAAEWQKHHAALIMLARIAEGCAKVMLKSLGRVILMICSEFQHPHSRVRWAAVNALCQLCADLGPVLQIHYHEVVLAELVNAMDDFQNPWVQAHAVSAVVNFSENSTPEVMKHYIGALISKLLALLKTGKQVLQEGAVKALGALADSSQGHFKEYYDAVMPHLKAILMNATDKSNRLLRAKSMECISLVGMAVGKDKFRDDAEQVVEILVALQGTPMGNDDPITSYMLEAWARLCKCLGQDFLPYMHFIMPPLLTSARLKPDVTVSDDDSIGTATLGDIGIRTSVLEEKATACNMLCCYADELKEGFVPWIDEVIDVLVPLLKFYIHEEVRRAAIAAMPGLLRSAELAVAKGQYHECDVKMLFDNIISALVEALGKESETEICSSILDSLNECLEISSHPLDEHQARAISERIEAVIIASRTRIKNNLDRSEAEDFDVDEKELFNEENEQEEVLDRVAKCLRILIRKSKASFLQLFDKLSVHITPMLGKGTTIEERRAAICIFNDVADHCGERALKYYETFLPSILEGINDDNPNIREAAVHGVGVCAKFGRLAFHPIVHEALIKLRTLLKRLELQYPHNRMAYDNAASALEKIVQFHWDSCYKIAEKKGKQHRAEWSDYDSRVFCTICLEEIQAKRMVPGKLPEEEDILDGIRQKLFSRTARLYVKNQLKIKFKNLIQSYRRLDHKKEHKNLELYIQIFDECPDEEKVISAECSDVGSTDGDTISRHQFKQNPPLANQEDAIRANEVLLLRKEIECLKLELMQVRDANDRSDIELQEQKNLREQLLLYDEKNNELQEQNKNLKQQLEEALTGQKVAMSLYEEQKEKVCHLDAELVKAEKLRSQMHNLIMELKGQIRVFLSRSTAICCW
uniref:TOG domain-containing protein n=1 Tax=Arundo donax TaxID=35708 RepID=A0A0A9CPZ9_ARUDO